MKLSSDLSYGTWAKPFKLLIKILTFKSSNKPAIHPKSSLNSRQIPEGTMSHWPKGHFAEPGRITRVLTKASQNNI